jgi:acyl-CoA synthetase (AMP-forming)/AMP-acid ligase II
MYLIDMIFYWARTQPHRPAVIQPDMVTSYQALADAVESISDRIERLRLDRKEPVSVSLANPSYFIATVFAVLRCGYSAALVSKSNYPLLQPAGLRNLIYDTEGQMLSGGRNIRFDASWLPRAPSRPMPRPERKSSNDDVSLIYFTSDTTGPPKKVVQTSSALQALLKYPFTCASGAHEKILIMTGLASPLGFNRICEILNVGKTACFAPDAASALALIELFNVEFVVASAIQASELAKAAKDSPTRQIDLKGVLVDGGKVEPEGIAAIRAALCRNMISQYGSTEAGVVALAPFDRLNGRRGAIGMVMPWAELEIVDESGRPVSRGANGLVRCRTPQLMENLKAGSDNLPGVKDGWFYPGDIGSVTDDGILCLSDRSSDDINRGGTKVSGARIEEILQALPQIKEAAACGIAGPSGLEEIWIAVVASGPIDIENIKGHLRDHQEVGVAPDHVFIVDELPRGELGKLQKFRLKEQLLSRHRVAQPHAYC